MMVSFIGNIFKNKKAEKKWGNYELVETKIDKRKDVDSDMFRYFTEEYYTDKNDRKGNKRITIATILVHDYVTFEEASSKSISYTIDKNKFSYSRHMDLHSKTEGTRTGVYTLNNNDGSYITSSMTYSFEYKGKERTLLSDVFPEFKQRKQDSIDEHNHKNSDIVSNIDTPASIEPELVIMLGPPSDEKQILMFEKYQKGFREDHIEDTKDWENYEKYMLNHLFTRKNNSPSQIEELFYSLLKVPIKINDYKFAFGYHQNKWVAGFSIPSSAVTSEVIPNMQWPPNTEIRNTAADIIGYILQRHWVFSYSTIPRNDNNLSTEGSCKSTRNETTICNHCGSVVGIDYLECPTCNRPIA